MEKEESKIFDKLKSTRIYSSQKTIGDYAKEMEHQKQMADFFAKNYMWKAAIEKYREGDTDFQPIRNHPHEEVQKQIEERAARALNDYFRERIASQPKQVIPITTQEKMNKNIFSLSVIERLFDALSLSISNPEDRKAFDTIFKNWMYDRLTEITSNNKV